MKSEMVGRLSIVSDDLVQNVGQKFVKDNFTISELSCGFPQILRPLLYEIIAVRLGFRKLCARWVPKMHTGAHKSAENGVDFDFLERAIPQRWR
jgi:hypothetical protein